MPELAAPWFARAAVEGLPGALHLARARFERAARNLLAVPDETLEAGWTWREQPHDVRHGLYHVFEDLEAAAADAGAALDKPGVPRLTAAERLLGQATLARWETHGLLLPLADEWLDTPPGGGEWTLRQTLGHMVQAQRSYTWRTAYAVYRLSAGAGLPRRAPAELLPPMPETEDEQRGPLADLRARLDTVLDLGIGLLRRVDTQAELAAPSHWLDFDVTAHFRLLRWSAHLREHTIQVEKTLEHLGRAPSEVERIVRLAAGAYGRLEAACLPLWRGDLPEAAAGALGSVLEERLAQVEQAARSLAATPRGR